MSIKDTTSNLLWRSGRVAGPLGMVAGFVSDVLKPLGALSSYLFFVSLLVMILSGGVWYFKVRRKLELARVDGKITEDEYKDAYKSNRWLVIFSFSAVSAPVLLLFAILTSVSGDRGFTGEYVESIARVQDTLFGLRQDVANVQTTADAILRKVDALATNKNTTAFIQDPKTPQEFYQNARFHQLAGQYDLARQDYEKYIASSSLFVDPYLSYVEMLKVQDGADATLQKFSALMQKNPSLPALRLAHAGLLPRDQRLASLEKISQEFPHFAPVFYLLSQEYSLASLGTQSFDDKKNEKKHLDAFLALDTKGEFIKHFVDKDAALKWKADAESRQKVLAAQNLDIQSTPVKLSAMTTNQGMILNIQITDQNVKEIFYKLPGDTEFKSTGFQAFNSYSTGLPMPIMYVMNVSVGAGAVISIQYKDVQDKIHGPYDIAFNADAEKLKSQKAMLAMMQWVSFVTDDKGTRAYFSALLSQKSILKEIKYTIGGTTPDQTLKFKPNAANTIDVNEDQLFIELPSPQSVTVTVTYTDDTTETRSFKPL